MAPLQMLHSRAIERKGQGREYVRTWPDSAIAAAHLEQQLPEDELLTESSPGGAIGRSRQWTQNGSIATSTSAWARVFVRLRAPVRVRVSAITESGRR